MNTHANTPHVSQQILDIAQQLVQTRGFNAFSYADIAEQLHVTKASLHYHFPSKGALGVSLIERYRDNFQHALDAIRDTSGTAAVKLRNYVQIYSSVLADERMCMCGMLAAEFQTLPKPMQQALDQYFLRNETWLTALLAQGRNDGSLSFNGAPADVAQYLIGSLEGTMMLARSHGGMARFEAGARRMLAELGA